MYLVTIDDRFVFFWTDPRPRCPYPVVKAADFIALLPNPCEWHLDTNAKLYVLARC